MKVFDVGKGAEIGVLSDTESMMYKMRTTAYHEWMPVLYSMADGLKRVVSELDREEAVAFIVHLERTALELRQQIGED